MMTLVYHTSYSIIDPSFRYTLIPIIKISNISYLIMYKKTYMHYEIILKEIMESIIYTLNEKNQCKKTKTNLLSVLCKVICGVASSN